jgi:hypothetical protein
VGDLDKPKLVFFFDEAHLLFKDAPKALTERIELVVRLVRSKGVGVYFVTQNPLDIPDTVLAQLGNRVQHALRAFTPRDQKAVKSAADTMRPKPGLDIGAAITELGVGEALVSFLDGKGRPCMTERVYVLPPASQIGPITPEQRQALLADSLVAGVYEKVVDRESAYEKIKGRTGDRMGEAPNANTQNQSNESTDEPITLGTQMGRSSTLNSNANSTVNAPAPAPQGGGLMGGLNDLLFGTTGPRGGRHDGLAQTMARSAVRTIGTTVGKEILRGVLGGIFGKGR